MAAWIHIFSQALLHSLWQFSLIGIVLWAVLKAIPTSRADLRYVVASTALYLAPVVFLLTCFLISNIQPASMPLADLVGNPSSSTSKIIVAGWTLGFVLFALKMAKNSHGVYRLSREPLAPLPDQLQRFFNRVVEKSNLTRSVRIGFSQNINSACTMGFWKPVIFLPLSFSNHLSVEEIEAIIAHEIAHIIRNDFIHHCIQTAIEAAFYYHPVIKLITNTISTERENACDDVAVSLIGDGKRLATGLLKAGLARNSNDLVLNAITPQSSNLRKRIGRLVEITTDDPRLSKMSRHRPLVSTLLGLAFLVLICLPALPVLASSASSGFDRRALLTLKNDVCDQLYADNIYWNPTYDTGGHAKLRISQNTIYMNEAPLPDATQASLRKVLKNHGLTDFETVWIRFYGDEVKLAFTVTPNPLAENDNMQIYLLKPGSENVTYFSKPRNEVS